MANGLVCNLVLINGFRGEESAGFEASKSCNKRNILDSSKKIEQNIIIIFTF